MGQGLKAYKLVLGKASREMVDIFESGTDMELVTAEEQQAFVNQWMKSMTKGNKCTINTVLERIRNWFNS